MALRLASSVAAVRLERAEAVARARRAAKRAARSVGGDVLVEVVVVEGSVDEGWWFSECASEERGFGWDSVSFVDGGGEAEEGLVSAGGSAVGVILRFFEGGMLGCGVFEPGWSSKN